MQQAAHGFGGAHVGDDLAEDSFLRGGGFEGEDLLEGFADVVVCGELESDDAVLKAVEAEVVGPFTCGVAAVELL